MYLIEQHVRLIDLLFTVLGVFPLQTSQEGKSSFSVSHPALHNENLSPISPPPGGGWGWGGGPGPTFDAESKFAKF